MATDLAKSFERDPFSAPETVPLLPSDQVKSLNPTDRVVVHFGYWLLALISLIILAVILDWCFRGMPALDPRQSDMKTALETAKSIGDMQWERTSKLFDLLILKALLPAFSTVL